MSAEQTRELDYFPFYHSYGEKLSSLSDAELGCLVRSLTEYSATGSKPEMAGAVAMAFSFISFDMDRAKQSYREKCENNRENGKKGGRPRKHTLPADGENGDNAAREIEENQTVFSETEKSQDKDEDKDENKDKSENNFFPDDKTERQTESRIDSGSGKRIAQGSSLPSVGPVGREKEMAIVCSTYASALGSAWNKRHKSQLMAFMEHMDAACCLRALEIAQDKGNVTWAYIRGILSKKRQQGVKTLTQWESVEASRKTARQSPPDTASHSSDGAQALRESEAWMDTYLAQIKQAQPEGGVQNEDAETC